MPQLKTMSIFKEVKEREVFKDKNEEYYIRYFETIILVCKDS